MARVVETKGEARAVGLLPQEHVSEMRTFSLVQGVLPIASGVKFTDGRVGLAWRSGRTEFHPDVDSVLRDYVGMAGLVWDKGRDRQVQVPRLFVFHRMVDHNFSGTGVAMEGAQFADGRVMLTWLGEYSSLVQWPCIEQAVTVHGHAGNTVLAWLDEEPVAS